MILGVGVDLVEVSRIAQVLERYGDRFLKRVFTPQERLFVKDKAEVAQRLAAFFAAKEACLKALGTGLRGISWQEVEVGHEPSGRPFLTLRGRAQERFQALQGKRLHLSLSHERTHAVAIVIIEGGRP